VLVLSLGVLYTAMITRMLPVKAAKLMTDMTVVKKIETASEHVECPLASV